MPNFGDARKHLAREASWAPEPEEPEETEDERELYMLDNVSPLTAQDEIGNC